MKLSVLIPCKNEQGNVTNIYSCLRDVLDNIKYELIFIDDGSSDDTLKELKELYKLDSSKVKIISFSRNFGKEAAIYAGMQKAKGDFVCIIDADLQQNPNYLIQMLDFLERNNDYDQVAMVTKKRKKNFLVAISSKIYYLLMDMISEIKFVDGASDFRMFRKNVSDAIISLTENNRFSKGIFSWVGFNTKYMLYDVEDRKQGTTKYNFKQSFRLAMDGIFGFSTRPLRLATILGVVSSTSAFVYFIYLLFKTLLMGVELPGYSSTLCMILLLGGIQLITIGILGEYLARTYLETKKRPIYIIREEIGVKE